MRQDKTVVKVVKAPRQVEDKKTEAGIFHRILPLQDVAPGGKVAHCGGGVAVIVVAPLYGIPVDWEALVGLSKRSGATLIEDAAQGYAARWKNRRLGSLGALATLSFGRGKAGLAEMLERS